jgi:uncharacterized protein YlzI (FlbEa/FlbD family)
MAILIKLPTTDDDAKETWINPKKVSSVVGDSRFTSIQMDNGKEYRVELSVGEALELVELG